MTTTDQSSSTGSRNVAVRVLNWLEAGYPEGIPRQDRFPLVALLRQRLSDDQVREIAAELTTPSALRTRGEDDITQEEIEELIHRQLAESPSAEDVSRVSARLAAGGWPLADSLD